MIYGGALVSLESGWLTTGCLRYLTEHRRRPVGWRPGRQQLTYCAEIVEHSLSFSQSGVLV